MKFLENKLKSLLFFFSEGDIVNNLFLRDKDGILVIDKDELVKKVFFIDCLSFDLGVEEIFFKFLREFFKFFISSFVLFLLSLFFVFFRGYNYYFYFLFFLNVNFILVGNVLMRLGRFNVVRNIGVLYTLLNLFL